jgi:Ca-activated chloride channel family protein
MRTIISSFAILIIAALMMAAVEPRVITGKVTDDQGSPLSGVSITVKNTNRGTMTDLHGNYRISLLPQDKVLVFSFIGFKDKEIRIKEKKVIHVVLETMLQPIEQDHVLYEAEERDSRGPIRPGLPVRSYAKKSTADGMGGYYSSYNPQHNTEGYATIHENGYKDVLKQPLSTFSIDVDKASYSNVRRFINQGQLPNKDAVRIEEMINYFSYDYPEPRGKHPFSVYTELSTCPWNPKHQLLHVGLKGKSIDKEELPASNLVFLLDVSGSMNSPNKLPLLKNAFHMLVNELRPEDRVAIVVYAGAAGLVLESTPGDEKQKILDAINRLSAGGSTAGGQGLLLAYKVAEDNFIKEGNNRIILATDGDFNVGVSSNAEMERLVEKKRDNGVFMTVLGFGMGNYKDDKMEIIADKGNGNYAYIDNILEARKVMVSEFGGTLFTIAKDVKFQLEFNPARVKAYRLIGYENRLLNDEDFNDDKKDAGEMGSGHNVTALYELIPAGSDENISSIDPLKYQKNQDRVETDITKELLTVKLRYKQPDGNTSTKFEEAVAGKLRNLNSTSTSFRFSAAVAEFGLLLRDSEYKGNASIEDIIALAQKSRGDDPEGYRGEFLQLVKTAGTLMDMRAEK